MSETAVLVIDMMNTYQHSDAEKLVENVERIIDPLAKLVSEANNRDDVDLIYVNDNYEDFTTDDQGLVRSALDGARPDLVRPIVPPPGCMFLTKVRHSAFYSTALEYLLDQLDTQRVVLTGQVVEQCILYTALDAYIRHYKIVVPPDAVAAIDAELGDAALKMMQRNMHAEIISAADVLG